MGGESSRQYWEIWYPNAAATGMLVARGLIDPTHTVLLHAAPDRITVEISDEQGNRLAYGKDLKKTDETPMCRLRRMGDRVQREDIWPGETDTGTPVILPGGEVGILKSWWHADDRKEWRWQIELYNSIR